MAIAFTDRLSARRGQYSLTICFVLIFLCIAEVPPGVEGLQVLAMPGLGLLVAAGQSLHETHVGFETEKIPSDFSYHLLSQ
jgi:hypothetical protein